MYYFIFYWIVCAFIMYFRPDDTGFTDRYPIFAFLISLLFGGFIVPANLFERLTQNL